MKTRIIGRPNSLQKLAFVDPKAVKQQGTTRNVYHLVQWTLDRSFEFFTNLNNTQQLFKNVDSNKLTDGEALVVKRIFFPVIVLNALDNTKIDSVSTWRNAGLENLISGKIDVVVGNQTVIKDLPISKANYFTKNSSNYDGFFIELESEIVIPQDVEYKVMLKHCGKFNGEEAFANIYFGVMLDGYGKILNLKKNI